MHEDNSVFCSLEIIEKRISEKLTVENIASSVYFSRNHFQRLFREFVGDSVMEYVNKRKLTLAGRELLETDTNILDIALSYGFDSHEGFTRSFKAYMGVTPKDYRKYKLTDISQNKIKETHTMKYSKITDEMIRELNTYVAKAKEISAASRAHETSVSKTLPFVKLFWNQMADKMDEYTDGVKAVLKRISSIAEHSDEIVNRFIIIKIIEDTAFMTHVMALHIQLTCSRNTPERFEEDMPLCEKYKELAQILAIKAHEIAQYFNELSSLIFKDMRDNATQKIEDAVTKGELLIKEIDGYEYIKRELIAVVDDLRSRSITNITEDYLDDLILRLRIISFSADTDVLRSGGEHADMFTELPNFIESLSTAADFFRSLKSHTIVISEPVPLLERSTNKRFKDIAYQGNILLFYTRGEVSYEKLGTILDEEQKTEVDAILCKIEGFINYAHNATDESSFKEIASILYEINTDMNTVAKKLGKHGPVIKFIANEVKTFADAVEKIIS
ncbi:MAG: helix-turn-helix transcriptional regulator [Oscillospiraceae bacterium]|jgi:AraC-like DNA-binding protein|nr:helix-turn-helix transcriptional regulator [Oscillospiraceae bacterium]